MRIAWRGWVIPIVGIIGAEIAMRAGNVESDALARPSAIVLSAVESLRDGSLIAATIQTLGGALGGLAIGGGLGVFIGIWFGLSPALARLTSLSIELLRPIPSVALIPVAMLVFGFGYRMEVAIVAFSCIWPMVLLTQSAISGVEPRLLEVSRLLGLSWFQQITKIVFPAILPRLFSALRLDLGIAFVVAVTVEIAANPHGIGYAMILDQQNLRPERMFALLAWVGVLGWGSNVLLLSVQRSLFGTVNPA